MKNESTKYALIGAALLALLAALVAFVALGARPDLPARDIPTPAPAFAAETMYVAPGETGSPQGGEDQSEDTEAQNSDTRQKEKPDETTDQRDQSPFAVERFGTRDDGGDGGQSGEGAGGDGDSSGAASPAAQPKPPARSDPDPSSGSPDPDPSSGSPDPDPSEIPNPYTNLVYFQNVESGKTQKPDAGAATLDGKSGFDPARGQLHFYAYPENHTPGYSVRAEYVSKATGGSKSELKGLGGDMYAVPLVTEDGEVTTVTLTILDSNGNVTVPESKRTYDIKYNAPDSSRSSASSDPSERKAPTIDLNIAEGQRFETSPATLDVAAKDADGEAIYSSKIVVTVSGAGGTFTPDSPAESARPSYALKFDEYRPDGDEATFTISVTATDNVDPNLKTTETRTVIYAHSSYGEEVGKVTVVIDATTVGLGIVDEFEATLHQGFPFPQDLESAMKDRGLRPNSSGKYDSSFFLNGITSGGLFRGQEIPETLKHKVDQDKITYSGKHSNDSLSQYDWTAESGWMYTLNSGTYPNSSLDSCHPLPGDTVYLIFTLAGGKDVGGTGSSGALSSYCGIWRNGGYEELHNLADYVVVEELTCEKPGRARHVCNVPGCGAWGSQPGTHADGVEIQLPATGNHTWVVDEMNTEAPEDGYDGVYAYVCSVCGATRTEVWPWEGGSSSSSAASSSSSSGKSSSSASSSKSSSKAKQSAVAGAVAGDAAGVGDLHLLGGDDRIADSPLRLMGRMVYNAVVRETVRQFLHAFALPGGVLR